MPDPLDFYFEINYPHEKAGWIDCYLTFGKGRHELSASDVFPPFMPMLHWLKAIVLQRLPHKFYWDEEGKGATFEAWPVAPNSPGFRLRVKHDRDEVPWVEGEFNREQLVRVFLPALRVFAAHQRPSRGAWVIRPEEVANLEHWLTHPAPSRLEFHTAQSLRIEFARSEMFDLPTQWLTWYVWDMPLLTWMLEDTDSFWHDWFALLENLGAGDLPANFRWSNRQMKEFTREMVEQGEWPETELARLWSMTVRAEPLPHPHHFRLVITETDPWYPDFPLLDEVLDRGQVVQSFFEAFEAFLEKQYQVLPNEAGQRFDLRTLPLERLKSLLAEWMV